MNLDLGGVAIGWREAVVGLIVIVAIYMLVVVLRMRSLQSSRRPLELPAKSEPMAVEKEPPPASQPEPEPEYSRESPSRGDDLSLSPLQAEVMQLRDEVDALRSEVAALRQDFLHQVDHLRSAQAVSPLYSDAMQMAMAGRDAEVIAERCGIARAEAELVVALAHSQKQQEQ